MTATAYAQAKRAACARHFDEVIAAIRTGMTAKAACSSDDRFPDYGMFKKFAGECPKRRSVVADALASRVAKRSVRRRRHTDAEFLQVMEILRDNPDKTERWLFANVVGPELPTRLMVQSRCRSDSVFAALRKSMLDGRQGSITPVITDKMRAAWIARRKTNGQPAVARPAGQLRQALRRNDLFAMADRVVSRRLDPHIRDDVRSDIVLALLEGALDRDAIGKAARGFEVRAQHWDRRFSVLSLDRTVGGADGESVAFVDIFTSDNWTYEAAG